MSGGSVDAASVELVVAQAGCSSAEAQRALQTVGGDVIDALLFLSSQQPDSTEPSAAAVVEPPARATQSTAPREPQSEWEQSVELVVVAASVDVARAQAALRECAGDVVNALLLLSSQPPPPPPAATARPPPIPTRKPQLQPRGKKRPPLSPSMRGSGSRDSAGAVGVEGDETAKAEQGAEEEEEEEDDVDVDAFAAGLGRRLKIAQARLKVAKEVLSSEQAYIAALFVLRDVYLHPLLHGDPAAHARPSLATLLAALERLIPLSAALLSALEYCVAHWSEASLLSPCFPRMETFEEPFLAYNEATQSAMKDLQEAEKDPAFEARLRAIRSAAADGTQELRSYMIQPVQRMPRYELLLRQMAADTPTEHEDAPALLELLHAVQQCNVRINDRMRRSAHTAQIARLRRLFTADPGFLDAQVLVKEGELKKRTATGRIEKRIVILLNDCLAYGKVLSRPGVERMYVLSAKAPLRSVRINDVPDQGKERFRFEIAFEGGKTFLVYLPSLEEKLEWMLAITNTTAKDMVACKEPTYRSSSASVLARKSPRSSSDK